jgi:3-hydroxy-5-methyl-1-naphthoate 3-O-methyltransferase
VSPTTVSDTGAPGDRAIAPPRDRAGQAGPLPTPGSDPSALWAFGVHGISLHQYVRWADDAGVFVALADGSALPEEVAARSTLSPWGAEALIGVLAAMRLVERDGPRVRLAAVARDYLDRRGPFYLGPVLYGGLAAPLPPRLSKDESPRRYSRFTYSWRDHLRYRWGKPQQFGRPEQLAAQHRRNLPVNSVAVATGLFDGLRHIADVGGGSGAFAIPLALRDPALRVTLVELPRALPHVTRFLQPHGLTDRVLLRGLNVHDRPWPLEDVDAVLFGNFLHFCDDDECLDVLRESHRLLPMGGRVFVHEMLWNDYRDGPLLTGLWNFWMATISAGRQRTRQEFANLLARAGFALTTVQETVSHFTLLVGTKRVSGRAVPVGSR